MAGAGIQIQVTIESDAQLRAALDRLFLKSLTLRKPLEEFGEHLMTVTHEHFERQESPAGEAWTPLSPRTLAMREKRGNDSVKILFVRGRMEASIGYRADDTTLAFGSNRKFPGGEKSALAIHQLGGKAGRGRKVTIPARPFIGINRSDQDALGRILTRYLAE